MEPIDCSLLRRVPAPLLRWYHAHARVLPWRSDPQPYHVWLSEIMLQQTRVEAATGYYHRFLAALPTIADLAAADEEILLKLWEGLGYYNRVRNLQKAAQQVMTDHGGELPADFDALLGLPGIGRYTAGAISSIAFGIPAPAVDGNVLRVLARVLASEENTSREPVKRAFGDAIAEVMPREDASAFNQALMELGATVCLPNGAPKCSLCPLAEFCKAHRLASELSYPLKDEKRARRMEERTVFLPIAEGQVGIRKRPNSGLLRGLWELPSTEFFLDRDAAMCYLKTIGLHPLRLVPLGPAKHIFTHLEWRMTGWAVYCTPLPDCTLTWATPAELAETYSLPGALKAYTAKLGQLVDAEKI